MLNYIVVGLNHKTAPLALRESLAFPDECLPSVLPRLVQAHPIQEGLILSTCNRVEIYATTAKEKEGIESVKQFLVENRQIRRSALEPHLYGLHNMAAVQHGFRVASSLDSMVVGESQIVGQVKKAFKQALIHKTSGDYLNRFMHRALSVSKKIRTKTNIAAGHVSLGSIACDLVKKIFGDLGRKRIVLVGTGKIGRLALERLHQEGVGQITLINRTQSKALEMASDFSAKVADFCHLWNVLETADIVITSLSGNHPFILKGAVMKMMIKRKQAPVFFIDLGVPRNVDPVIGEMENIYLYNIDDLEKVARANRLARAEEAQKAEMMIEEEASIFYSTIDQLLKKLFHLD